MRVELAKDQKKVRRYIQQRIKEYPDYVNEGPGRDEAPIQLVTLGYYLEQTGYFALVFDTRPDADSDGEWTLHLHDDVTLLHFPKWCSLIRAFYNDKPINLVLPHGGSCEITRKTHTHESIAEIFGEMLRDTMIALCNEGALESLPLADDAFLIVEEFDGRWGWPKTYETRKSVKLNRNASIDEWNDGFDVESDEDRKQAFVATIRKLPVKKQIAYWISELDRRAAGKPSELDKVFLEVDLPDYGNECALNELERIGKRSAVPLLELAYKWSQHPEWNGDRPQRQITERPMQNVAIGAIWKVRDLGYANEQIEQLLQQIIRRACRANADRRLWGIIPFHAAKCLHSLFVTYPEPTWDPTSNRLIGAEQYQSRRKSTTAGHVGRRV